MKKMFALLVPLVIMFSCAMPSIGASVQMPPSAMSTDSPNKDRVITVALFKGGVEQAVSGAAGETPTQMTVGEFVANHPTLGSSTEAAFCRVVSTDSPKVTGNTWCVSAGQNPATVKVATFNVGKLTATSVREMSYKDFYNPKTVSTNGVKSLDCLIGPDGKNTGVCKIAQSD